jgi:RNA polymerase-binding transcription factor DksA
MTAQELDLLKEKLLALRQDVFQRLRRLDDGWQELAEKDTEFEEEAQKAGLSELNALLDEREKEEIEAIDLALDKMDAVQYGKCEGCGTDSPAAVAGFACCAKAEEKSRIPAALP